MTLPYSPGQWADIDALGRKVDRVLDEADVRLTIGGEPTFVSIDDMEGAEWTTSADGPAKRERGAEMARRLIQRFAPGGVLHHGQGKWYPGEPLPRWQIAVLWRTDGEALWADRTLLADPSDPGERTGADVRALAAALAAALGVGPAHLYEAFEDPLQLLLNEARLPSGEPATAGVSAADLAVPSDERAALMAQLDAARGEPTGVVIPLHRRPGAAGGWGTTTWTLRRGQLFLLPGDSAMGLRLPLDSLTWSSLPADPDRSPFEDRPSLAVPGADDAPHAVPPATVVPVEDCPPSALCVEVRGGQLFVFLPPLSSLDHVVELLHVVERAAASLGVPVVLEGYPPPRDHRLQQIVVAPDPGVLEINVQPAASWPELVDITTSVHDLARQSRLGTETFQLDGRHSGTGGGNHLTLGGAVAADSPMLRRPDLLRSMVTFWQHHPSLSYLFSGRFIGPTSQAPRIDEGRAESLYELEIAFAELERLGGEPPPWLVDRLLRHLLVDITGNTHRAEFCIDKLFSPDSERGRLGLVELRGFEMPPHPQMALVQALLVRALVARFWNEPYSGPMVRWGTELHDRFLLPHHVAADVTAVVDDLRAHGLAFEHDWLAPFIEFRFPRLGSVDIGDVHIELRSAIEPWHVLGEEVTATSTARYVDSSLERMQVRATGLTEGRHLVTCNGIPVPLRPTGVPGVHVAGVRYRAWQPPSALHPTIGVHTPLTIDLIDLWSARSLGGCTYHVAHPGGRNYDTFPVNANEAEARRRARFDAHGHTPGPIGAAELAEMAARAPGGPMAGLGTGHDYPRTLDLRRASRPAAAPPPATPEAAAPGGPVN